MYLKYTWNKTKKKYSFILFLNAQQNYSLSCNFQIYYSKYNQLFSPARVFQIRKSNKKKKKKKPE